MNYGRDSINSFCVNKYSIKKCLIDVNYLSIVDLPMSIVNLPMSIVNLPMSIVNLLMVTPNNSDFPAEQFSTQATHRSTRISASELAIQTQVFLLATCY